MFSCDSVCASEICGILDLDGFYFVKDGFVPREAAFTGFDYLFRTCTFDIPQRDLCRKDWVTARYATGRVHGLSLRALPGEDARPLGELDRFVKDCYRSSRTEFKKVMGYKGGSHERDLLRRLGIPAANVEDYGCPKFDRLVREEGFESLPSCRLHASLPEKFHCPTSETFAFMRWVRLYARSVCPIPPPVERPFAEWKMSPHDECPIPPPVEWPQPVEWTCV